MGSTSRSKTYPDRSGAQDKKKAVGGTVEEIEGQDVEVSWNVTEDHSKTFDNWTDAKDKKDVVGGNIEEAGADYKVEWTTTETTTHKKWFESRDGHSGEVIDERTDVVDHKWEDQGTQRFEEIQSGSPSMVRYEYEHSVDETDTDYKIEWYDSTHHKEWRGSWKYKWFEEERDARGWGRIIDKNRYVADRDYRAKKWDRTHHKVWVGGYKYRTHTKWYDSYWRAKRKGRIVDRDLDVRYKARWKTKDVDYRTHTRWYNSRRRARRKGRVVGNKCSSWGRKCVDYDYRRERYCDRYRRYCRNRKYKARWRTKHVTYHTHTKWYDSYWRARRKGSIVDRDYNWRYKARWKTKYWDSTHHKEWRGGWDYKTFETKSHAEDWGKITETLKQYDTDYRAKKWMLGVIELVVKEGLETEEVK
ncbi:hypothetical protein AKJ65_08085 [candidate division MSBL1 archaeon SCGC-AAA259E19]|uniref:Uncharacterized protein n=1 Tax=candidate division MSBL1 archaeon SCGC-AAA259E19 TaxID=1698264 RepID=A0A133UCZ2_9EURY|nr:hypothetical protein AKJ65_08085 [candidate division MSBL1 archaeon SCGC-AAA259E19]